MAVAHDTLAFAYLIKADGSHLLLRLRDEQSVDTLNLGRTDPIYAIEVLNDGRNIAVFVAFDDKVLVSEDLGNNWTNASASLPRRPHCAGLRLARTSNGEDVLYLSTYGRSVWKAPVKRA